MKKIPKYTTLKTLEKMGACPEAKAWFKRVWPNKKHVETRVLLHEAVLSGFPFWVSYYLAWFDADLPDELWEPFGKFQEELRKSLVPIVGDYEE